MYLLQNVVIHFALLQVIQAFQIYAYATSNATCERDNQTLHPCAKFDDLDTVYFDFYLSEINITLLPGDYYIFRSMRFNFHDDNFLLTSWQNQGQVRLVCDGGDFSIACRSMKTITIRNVEFYNCGNATPIISVKRVIEVNIQYVNCINCTEGFLEVNVWDGTVNISHCIFQGCTNNFAVKITASVPAVKILVFDTIFANNTFSSLMLNKVVHGFIIIDRCTFNHNKAGEYSKGAAIAVEGSTAPTRIYGILLIRHCHFLNNHADDGGAVVISDYHTTISHTRFTNNSALLKGGAIKLEGENLQININCMFIHNSAWNGGVIYIALENSRQSLYSVVSSEFINNRAAENGGVLMAVGQTSSLKDSAPSDNAIVIQNVTLDRNSGKIGGTLYLSKVENITILDCILTNNFGHHVTNISNGGAIAIMQDVDSVVSIKKNLFRNNKAQIGGALWIYTSSPNLMQIIDSSFYGNTAVKLGGSVHAIGYTIKIHRTIFYKNGAELGGALYLNHTAVNLSSGIYMENSACAGGAIFSEMSYLHIGTVHLVANRALSASMDSFLPTAKGTSRWSHNCYTEFSGKGGAIFIEDKIEDCTLNSCRLTWNDVYSINSTNNSAKLGSVLYGGMIRWCARINSTQIAALSSPRDSYNYPSVSSDSIQLCFYNTDCGVRSMKRTVYLGQSFEVHVVCLDQVMQGKDCVVTTSQYAKTPGVKYGVGENIRAFNGQENLLVYTFMTSDVMCTGNKWGSLEVNVSIRACPLGFEKIGDHCSCDHRLLEVFKTLKCLIENVSITMNDDGWFGYDSSHMRINNICPLKYCTLKKSVVMGSYPHVQCDNNRGGILCSSCVSNYSLVLGSWKCRNCSALSSYNFIWVTVLLALAGVLLVTFLMLLKMTVSSGTLNGLILYANILSVSGYSDYRNCTIHPFLRAFISWINLDLGIEVCFYSGIDVYQKTWLQFVFPFYIWFLVGVIILVCHFSPTVMKLMGMRNIEVLATLFLLSYAKLLKTIVTTLSLAMINISSVQNLSDVQITERVWLYDAHLTYLGPKHWPLFAVALTCLVFLFLPYTMLLLFGQCLANIPSRKGLRWIHNPKLTSVLDAYYAPYSKHCRCWTGLGLLLRCILFSAFGSNSFWTVISVNVLLLAHASYRGGIYQKKVIGILEVIFLANLLVVSLSFYRDEFCKVLTASICISFVLFIVITFYHVYFVLVRSQQFKFQEVIEMVAKISEVHYAASAKLPPDNSKSHTSTFIDLRESLIDN